jgi:hypothetical protein
MRAPQNLQGLAFKWMSTANNGDRFGKVFEMGSVSWFPSIGFTMID